MISSVMAFVIAVPILIVRYILKHPSVLVIIFIALAVMTVFNTCSKSGDLTSIPIPDYQKKAPQTTAVVPTLSRVYYVDRANIELVRPDFAILHDYYFYDGRNWINREGPLSLDKKYYGEFWIYDRSSE